MVQECRKTAIILPDYMCREVKKFLAQEKKIPNIFVGQESYTDLDWTISIDGLLPRHLVQRIHGAWQSGIWQWWIKLLGKNTPGDVIENHPVKAAPIKGNIVIVFILWICCLAVTFVSYLKFISSGRNLAQIIRVSDGKNTFYNY